MYTQNEQALSRPTSAFDVPALSIIALAGLGRAVVKLAYALDALRAESRASSRGAPHRRRPAIASAERVAAPESWRLK